MFSDAERVALQDMGVFIAYDFLCLVSVTFLYGKLYYVLVRFFF